MPVTEQKFHKHLESALRVISGAQGVPGLVAALVERGEITFHVCLGSTDLDVPSPVDLDTRFPLASVSKVVTAAALHAEGGRLPLSTAITNALPELAWADERGRHITLRQLLSHTAGLDDIDPVAWADDAAVDDLAHARAVAAFAARPFLALPGERYAYSNAGYDVAGLALARSAGTSFETAARERVLAPLGMEASSYYPHPPVASAAVGHVGDGLGGVIPYRGSIGSRSHPACGTLASTARDLAKLVAALADPSRAPVSGFTELATRVASTGRADGAWSGLGVRLRERRGETVVEHGGWDPGFRCAVAAIPARCAGALVLTNFHWSSPAMMNCMLDALQGIRPEIAADELTQLRRPAPAGRSSG
jgi:CubicO group peptidase (beta-lactamase class C family)